MKLLIGLPNYQPGACVAQQQLLRLYARHPDWTIAQCEVTSSLLAWGFNTAWAQALNMREKGELTHFLLLHSDIRPREEDWFDRLLAEMETSGAQVLSAIIPIKDQRGLTSTALDTDLWRPLRLTQKQIREQLPVTWSDESLLVNTGCMLVDMSEDWVEKICFTINDRIVRDNDGQWRAYVQPEDWDFSRQCRKLGVRVAATRAVTIEHFGIGCWASDKVWGEESDSVNGSLMLAKINSGELASEEEKA